MIENNKASYKLTYAIIYDALTFFTVYFVIVYLKRLFILTFLTLIAPLVALTYPIDKIKDGRAQAFEYWLREYIMNAILPIIHITIYLIFVWSAMELASDAPLYAICAIAFMVPAEKIIKE